MDVARHGSGTNQQQYGKLTNDLLFFSPIARSHRYRAFLQIEASNTVNGLLMIGRNVAAAGEPGCLAVSIRRHIGQDTASFGRIICRTGNHTARR